MEKWRAARGKSTKTESVLPPTRRSAGPTCLPVDKKKDRKWSLGGLLRRISSGGPNHDVSSNDEDITYIPGHMLSKRSIKKPSRMRSKLGKNLERPESPEISAPSNDRLSYGSKDTLELIRGLRANVDRPRDAPCNDSVNSRSSEGSLDAQGRGSRINRMKARARAKRDRLRGNSSSDDDSHRSSQSLGQFRGDDGVHLNSAVPGGSQKIDACSRRTRGARTERYIRRMYRDDGTSGSESKLIDAMAPPPPPPPPPPRSNDLAPSRLSSNSVDSSLRRKNDEARSFAQAEISTPAVAALEPGDLVFKRNAAPREIPQRPREQQFSPRVSQRPAFGCLGDTNDNETFEREKLTWPQHLRRATPPSGIYGSLRQPRVLPPEPPPRSSKSRVIFSSVYGNAPVVLNGVNNNCNEARSSRRYQLSPLGARNERTYNSDNEVLLSDHVTPVRLRYLWQNNDEPENHRRDAPTTRYCNSLDRPQRRNCIREFREEQENRDPRPCFTAAILPPPSEFAARSTASLPKGLQLFSRQRLSHCGDDDPVATRSSCISEKPLEERIIPRLRKPPRLMTGTPSAVATMAARTREDDEAEERKRSSKNLEDALSELEAIYNSLRLSDEDLLERAEQRSMEEYRDRAARSAAENSRKSSDGSSNERDEDEDDDDGRGRDRSSGSSQRTENDARMKDDMAYRRMNPKTERPPSVNGQAASLTRISYLATSPNLSSRDADYCHNDPRKRGRRDTPDLTRDDLLFRSISHANNALRVIEPQPPFGIPLGPVIAATESDYLHVKPAKPSHHTRSLYIPQSEPDVASDDLAFRNLRKDAPRDSAGFNGNSNGNSFVPRDATRESPFLAAGTNKKRAVRSMSADLYGIIGREKNRQNDWYNDYIRSTQKLRFLDDDDVAVSNVPRTEHSSQPPKNVEEFRDDFSHRINRFGLDINGNRPKSALQRKIQVHVPREAVAFAAVDAKLDEEPRDSKKLVGRESDDEEPDRCDSRSSRRSADLPVVDKDEKTKTIESFTEQELSEYKQLCQDLEKLIQRTAETNEKEEEKVKERRIVARESENDNSQSEFDELEKLLIDDYELPTSIAAAFDEIVEAVTSTERDDDDDQSSSRSTGLGAESLSSDNFQPSPTKTTEKNADDDASFSSELGTGGGDGSLTDSVYDKFNQLLREVNEAPRAEPARTFNEYPTDERLQSDDGNSRESPKISGVAEETRRSHAEAIREDPEVETEAIGTNDEDPARPDETPWRSLRARKADKRVEDDKIGGGGGGVAKPAGRQGENVDDERACNDGFYACKDTSKRTVRKLSRVTNRVTAYHVVVCSLFLTLLITMIVAQ